MRTEVHVHGTIILIEGVSVQQVERALRPWLDYLDVGSLKEARSLEKDEPGIVFDRKRWMLELCWTGDVGSNFQRVLGDALAAVGPLTEEASAVEVTYYRDERDDVQLMFVGPTPYAVHDAQRRMMIEEISNLLGRQFAADEVSQVAGLVNELFKRDWERRKSGVPDAPPATPASNDPTPPSQLH
jgi:hypothetical protein